jgi:bisphosphoglycerate-independent phosphoglycerate mutase (AlkP superfamily)
MHTGDDAFLFVRGHTIQRRPRLLDLAPTIYTLLGLPIPHEFEGRSLL